MKVLIVNNIVPFSQSDTEELATNLQRNLVVAGHETEIIRIPFQWESPTSILSQMLIARTFELQNVDHVVAFKFPAYLIRHARKTVWLLHRYRQAYDRYRAGQIDLPAGPQGGDLVALIRNAENQCFAESRRIFTNSGVTREHLRKYNSVDADVLIPPVNDPELFTGGEGRDYIFAGGPINRMTRQLALVRAMARTHREVKLLIAGPPDTPDDRVRLESEVEKFNLQDRVKLDLRFLPRPTYARYVNQCVAVANLPLDGDSFGYVAMEAATAAKPLITTTDSGGILTFAIEGETGWVVDPDTDSLAHALNSAFTDRVGAKERGRAAQTLLDGFGLNWQRTIRELLQ